MLSLLVGLLASALDAPPITKKRYSAEVDFLRTTVKLMEAVEVNRTVLEKVREALPGCKFNGAFLELFEDLSECSCPLDFSGHGQAKEWRRALPNLIIAGAAKAGTTTTIELLRRVEQPQVRFPPFPAAMSAESLYWVPDFIPVLQKEDLGWRGWRCGDATSFIAAILRLHTRPDCSTSGYRQMVWGYPSWSNNSDNFYVDKTPDYLLWPHIHVALRMLVASGTKIVVFLRDPFLRFTSHYLHFEAWRRKQRAGKNWVSDSPGRKAIAMSQTYAGDNFQLFTVKQLTDANFVKFRDEVTMHASDRKKGKGLNGVLDAYTEYLYSLCDVTDWG
eukprot:TRINITY_DN94197_c0_g1_i1.p1 TRINITY_DN94197_c0_g1~~TRINITY_DN94197_c0_g1_i1.p1  ORF type:complete len:332 (-),score=50.93 TRINITY_DN94197_c0_g1_i1:40-1035(-)